MWITCLLAIKRWIGTIPGHGRVPRDFSFPEAPADDRALVPTGSALIPEAGDEQPVQMSLGNFAFEATPAPIAPIASAVAAAAFIVETERAYFENRFAIVSDTVFGILSHTTVDTATLVSISRDSSAETMTLHRELVPAGTIFTGLIAIQPFAKVGKEVFDRLAAKIGTSPLQVGSARTYGQGLATALLSDTSGFS